MQIVAVLVAFLAQLAGAIYLFSKGENMGATAALSGTVMFGAYLASRGKSDGGGSMTPPPNKNP